MYLICMKRYWLQWGILFIATVFFSSAFAQVDDEVITRIKPLGQVHILEASDLGNAKKTVTSLVKTVEPGQLTYESHCVICHQTGLASAPKFRDAADWKPRMGKSIDELVAIALKGLNAMPPKGTCMTCTDKDIKDAILYMLPRS